MKVQIMSPAADRVDFKVPPAPRITTFEGKPIMSRLNWNPGSPRGGRRHGPRPAVTGERGTAGPAVPADVQWPKMPLPQLLQEGLRCSGVAVPLQFHPLHLAGLQTHRRVIAGLLAVPGTAGVHQGWLPFQHPLAPQLRVSPEMGLVSEEYLAASAPRLVPQGGVFRREGLRLASFALSSRFLGRLKANPRRCRACPRVDGGNSGNRCGSG